MDKDGNPAPKPSCDVKAFEAANSAIGLQLKPEADGITASGTFIATLYAPPLAPRCTHPLWRGASQHRIRGAPFPLVKGVFVLPSVRRMWHTVEAFTPLHYLLTKVICKF